MSSFHRTSYPCGSRHRYIPHPGLLFRCSLAALGYLPSATRFAASTVHPSPFISPMYHHQLVFSLVGHHWNSLGNNRSHLSSSTGILAVGRISRSSAHSQSIIHRSACGCHPRPTRPTRSRVDVVSSGPCVGNRWNERADSYMPLSSRSRVRAASSPLPWNRIDIILSFTLCRGRDQTKTVHSHQKGLWETCPPCPLRPYWQSHPTTLALPLRTQYSIPSSLAKATRSSIENQCVGKQEHIYIERRT